MKYKYYIGQWVKVKARIREFSYDKNNNRIIYKENLEGVVGQICGAAKRQMGKLVNASMRYSKYFPYEPEDYDSHYLKVEKTITVWFVRTGLINKPMEVLEEDMTILINTFINKRLPWFDPFYGEKYRKRLSDTMKKEVKHIIRDSKGKFAFTSEYKTIINKVENHAPLNAECEKCGKIYCDPENKY